MLFCNPRFNPTLVRLRHLLFGAVFIALFMFQSHAGSIEALYMPAGILSSGLGFNPTLVRLRPPSSIMTTNLR